MLCPRGNDRKHYSQRLKGYSTSWRSDPFGISYAPHASSVNKYSLDLSHVPVRPWGGGGGVNTDQDTIPALREPTGRRYKPVSRNFQHRVVNSVIKDEQGTVGIQERHSAQPGRSRKASQRK